MFGHVNCLPGNIPAKTGLETAADYLSFSVSDWTRAGTAGSFLILDGYTPQEDIQ